MVKLQRGAVVVSSSAVHVASRGRGFAPLPVRSTVCGNTPDGVESKPTLRSNFTLLLYDQTYACFPPFHPSICIAVWLRLLQLPRCRSHSGTRTKQSCTAAHPLIAGTPCMS